MLNFGSKTLMPDTTRQSPGMVNAVWLSYCPGLSLLKLMQVLELAIQIILVNRSAYN